MCTRFTNKQSLVAIYILNENWYIGIIGSILCVIVLSNLLSLVMVFLLYFQIQFIKCRKVVRRHFFLNNHQWLTLMRSTRSGTIYATKPYFHVSFPAQRYYHGNVFDASFVSALENMNMNGTLFWMVVFIWTWFHQSL